jgi:hypothetical protein
MRLIKPVRPVGGGSYLGESECCSYLPEDDAGEYEPYDVQDTWLIWRSAARADSNVWRSGCCLVLLPAADVCRFETINRRGGSWFVVPVVQVLDP